MFLFNNNVVSIDSLIRVYVTDQKTCLWRLTVANREWILKEKKKRKEEHILPQAQPVNEVLGSLSSNKKHFKL